MESPVVNGGMDNGADLPLDALLKPLSLVDLETLLAALDPRLDGFGAGPSCLDDARAFLARLASGAGAAGGDGGGPDTATMEEWIEVWRAAGGNRQTLRLMVQTLMSERMASLPVEGGQAKGRTDQAAEG